VPVLAYLLGMPARKRPTPEDTVTVRRILLDGLTRDADIFDLAGELAPLHPRNNIFPGEFLQLAADALNWCGASRTDPLSLEGSGTASCPSAHSAADQNKKLQYAVLTAAALHGGTEPDLLDEIAWWQTDDFWQYALFATVACIRAAGTSGPCPAPISLSSAAVAVAFRGQVASWVPPLLASLEDILTAYGGTAGILREQAPPPLNTHAGADAVVVSADNALT
jgi:hypothetical protein